jgi:glycosyltransferase involved in cell wall biosynthesis
VKVLFISNLFPDTLEPYRGLDNACLLHYLAAHCEIRVVSPRPALPLTRAMRKKRSPRAEDAPFQPIYLNVPYLPKVGSLVNHRLFARELRGSIEALRREFPFDAVLCAWLYPDGCAVTQLAEEWRVPVVLIAQGSDVHSYLRMPARRRLIVEASRCAAAVVTRSADLASQLCAAGVPRNRTHPIYNGVDATVFHPGDRAAARRELGLPEIGSIVLFAGNFYPVKDPLMLVRAHAKVCRKNPDTVVSLVMVGGGPLEDKVKALAGSLGFGSRVVLAGRRSAADVSRYMRAANLLCLSSRNEGVPNVVLEAFASGIPVVSTDVGGISEVLCHEFLGRLCAPGDETALAAALQETLLRPARPDRIVEYASRFSWEGAARAYLRLLVATRS